MNRKYSLRKSYEIEKLLKLKQSVGNKYYALYYEITSLKTPKLAFSVSRKFKTAVKRNYEKRVAKEIFRKHLNLLENLKILVVIKEPVKNLSFFEKEKQILSLIDKILRSKHEKEK